MQAVLRAVLAVAILSVVAVPFPAAAHSLEELQANLGRSEQYFEKKNEPAPSFTLQDADGKPVRLEDFRGKVVVLNFVFVSCTDVCPVHAEEIAKAQAMVNITPMRERVAFVTVTTDPKRDTPDILRSYAGDHGLDLANWQVLTSGPNESEDKTRKLAEAFGHKFKPTDDGMQLHGVVTHVIDQDGVWRGNFHGLNFQTLSLVTFVNALTNKMVPHEHEEAQGSWWEGIRSLF